MNLKNSDNIRLVGFDDWLDGPDCVSGFVENSYFVDFRVATDDVDIDMWSFISFNNEEPHPEFNLVKHEKGVQLRVRCSQTGRSMSLGRVPLLLSRMIHDNIGSLVIEHYSRVEFYSCDTMQAGRHIDRNTVLCALDDGCPGGVEFDLDQFLDDVQKKLEQSVYVTKVRLRIDGLKNGC